ncbi:MAG: hypothetical protein AAFU49_24840, partial [Pseudomonadota bacterium]
PKRRVKTRAWMRATISSSIISSRTRAKRKEANRVEDKERPARRAVVRKEETIRRRMCPLVILAKSRIASVAILSR